MYSNKEYSSKNRRLVVIILSIMIIPYPLRPIPSSKVNFYGKTRVGLEALYTFHLQVMLWQALLSNLK